MPKMKKDVVELRKRAIQSLILAIELFNRPHEEGRPEAVLILLHHAFELFLKAIIKDKTGKVHSKGEKYSYGFDKCMEICQNQLKIILQEFRVAHSTVHIQAVAAPMSHHQRRSLSFYLVINTNALIIYVWQVLPAFRKRLCIQDILEFEGVFERWLDFHPAGLYDGEIHSLIIYQQANVSSPA